MTLHQNDNFLSMCLRVVVMHYVTPHGFIIKKDCE